MPIRVWQVIENGADAQGRVRNRARYPSAWLANNKALRLRSKWPGLRGRGDRGCRQPTARLSWWPSCAPVVAPLNRRRALPQAVDCDQVSHSLVSPGVAPLCSCGPATAAVYPNPCRGIGRHWSSSRRPPASTRVASRHMLDPASQARLVLANARISLTQLRDNQQCGISDILHPCSRNESASSGCGRRQPHEMGSATGAIHFPRDLFLQTPTIYFNRYGAISHLLWRCASSCRISIQVRISHIKRYAL